jgi:integrase
MAQDFHTEELVIIQCRLACTGKDVVWPLVAPGGGKVQEWLGHANTATTRIYDHRRTRPEDSPTFKVSY